MSSYTAMRQSIYENRALPDAIISPAEVIGEEERDRMEAQWNAKFRRGGAGRVLVAESQMKVDILRQQMGDLAQLAEVRASMEDIANAFGVPIAFLTTNVNMANLQAAERQHAHNAVHPRLTRRDEKLNTALVPLYDSTGRLFLHSEDPTPADPEGDSRMFRNYLEYGIWTINDCAGTRRLAAGAMGRSPVAPRGFGASHGGARHRRHTRPY